MRLLKRLAKALAVLVLVLVAGLFALGLAVRHPKPAATPGPEAEELARAAVRAVDGAAWERTGAVRWTLAGRNAHLWDRRRGFDRLRSGDLEVLLDVNRRTGVARRAGRPLADAELGKALDDAYAYFCNDSFWLNPVVKVFDDGVRREVAVLDGGEKALLVTYTSGGVTPGDSYLWRLAPDGTPRAWRMYVRIIPVGGLETSWEDWVTLSTGAKIATTHKSLFTLRVTDLAGAKDLAELEPTDPFAELTH